MFRAARGPRSFRSADKQVSYARYGSAQNSSTERASKETTHTSCWPLRACRPLAPRKEGSIRSTSERAVHSLVSYLVPHPAERLLWIGSRQVTAFNGPSQMRTGPILAARGRRVTREKGIVSFRGRVLASTSLHCRIARLANGSEIVGASRGTPID